MSRLNKVITNCMKAQNIKNKELHKNVSIPQYGTTGKVIKLEKKIKNKKIKTTCICIAFFLSFIYLPGFFIKDNDITDISYTVPLNTDALKLNQDLLATAPTEDFDNDGIDNSKEILEGTNPWNKDSDFDGASDYYEIYISKTNAYNYDSNLVINLQVKFDEENNQNLQTPYKMDNVILWANDYESKALGGVVESFDGYYFYNFNGYAQFPEEKGKYVYGVKDNTRILLNYLKDENAWEIDGYNKVEIYDKPLEEIIELSLFSKKIYLKSNGLSKILAFILPDKGFVTAVKCTTIDIEPDTNRTTTAEIQIPQFNYEDNKRFSTNTNLLSNLQYVREMINNNKCIAVSLFDEQDGEYIAIIYGYKYNGNLLIADCNTMKPIGEIYITEIGRKFINNDGKFVYDTIFAWKTLGFSSSSNDRISFFAVSSSVDTHFTEENNSTSTDATYIDDFHDINTTSNNINTNTDAILQQ